MGNIAKDIKEDLERSYNIPFFIKQDLVNGKPSFLIGPYNKERDLFDLKIEYSNQMRMTINFLPELHGRMFIYNMGRQSVERRLLFLKYWELLNKRQAEVSIKINDYAISLEEPVEKWPEVFTDFKLKVMKFPLPEQAPFDYEKVTLSWIKPVLGMILSLAELVPNEDTQIKELYSGAPKFEGEEQRFLSNRYERNPLNRELCLLSKGYRCAVCGMSFEETYGSIGTNYIQVHHIIPISMCGEKYQIDPINDLVPVCPNCHAMLHRKNPPYTVDELKRILSMNRKKYQT